MIVLGRDSKTYNTGYVAVCNFSLQVLAGQLLPLSGGSGCGKTSTLNAGRTAAAA
jgi:putative spermidine/putrescine transport system ATP-binding protein